MRLSGWSVSIALLRVPPKFWWRVEVGGYDSRKAGLTCRTVQLGPIYIHAQRKVALK